MTGNHVNVSQSHTLAYLQLSRTCKLVRLAVVQAWRPLALRALVLASSSERIILLKPITGDGDASERLKFDYVLYNEVSVVHAWAG